MLEMHNNFINRIRAQLDYTYKLHRVAYRYASKWDYEKNFSKNSFKPDSLL